ncbi:MAG: NosD domain-containing protein [Candidatus Micrarchaeota archaeon]
MARRAQTGAETIFLIAGAIFLAIISFAVVRTQFISSGASNVQSDSGAVATAFASFAPSARAGIVSAPPQAGLPTACACEANSTCPALYSLQESCQQECVSGGCIPCNAECVFGCQALAANSQSHVLTGDLVTDSTCFTVSGNDVSIDCAGHSITGSAAGEAVLLEGGGANDFKLVNCNISGFSAGANLTDANGANVSGNAFNDVDYAVWSKGGANLFAAINTINNASIAGFYLESSNGANIQHNNILLSVPGAYGIYLSATVRTSEFNFNSVAGGACAFNNCIDGPCGPVCPADSGTCAGNTFTGNIPQACTSPNSFGE